jgi:hypothetical protein
MQHRELYFHSRKSDRNLMLDRMGIAWSRKILFKGLAISAQRFAGTAWAVSRNGRKPSCNPHLITFSDCNGCAIHPEPRRTARSRGQTLQVYIFRISNAGHSIFVWADVGRMSKAASDSP